MFEYYKNFQIFYLFEYTRRGLIYILERKDKIINNENNIKILSFKSYVFRIYVYY